MYLLIQERIKSLNNSGHVNNHVLTEEEKAQHIKKSFYSALCSGNKEKIIEFLDDGD